MECSEVQEKFSAYVEDIIPPEEKQLVDEHLKACDRCSESLADLKKTLEYVGNLREVEPPPWLVQKIMARVRSDAEAKKGINLVWFATGKEDFLIETSRLTVDMLKKHGFDVAYTESSGGHTWINWRHYLNDFAQLLFRE